MNELRYCASCQQPFTGLPRCPTCDSPVTPSKKSCACVCHTIEGGSSSECPSCTPHQTTVCETPRDKKTGKREGELKTAFYSQMSQVKGYYILSFSTRAAPDRAVFGHGKITTWEFKHGTPGFDSPGDQELMCARLATAGHCRYVVWQEYPDRQRTLIAHPMSVMQRVGWSIKFEAWCEGFDIKWLVDYVRRTHEC